MPGKDRNWAERAVHPRERDMDCGRKVSSSVVERKPMVGSRRAWRPAEDRWQARPHQRFACAAMAAGGTARGAPGSEVMGFVDGLRPSMGRVRCEADDDDDDDDIADAGGRRGAEARAHHQDCSWVAGRGRRRSGRALAADDACELDVEYDGASADDDLDWRDGREGDEVGGDAPEGLRSGLAASHSRGRDRCAWRARVVHGPRERHA